jgi:hypothetical protein
VRSRLAGAAQAEGQAMIDSISRLYSQGQSLSAIGSTLGISRGKVAGAIDRARKAGDQRFPLRPLQPRPKPPVVASPAAIVGLLPPVVAEPRPFVRFSRGNVGSV